MIVGRLFTYLGQRYEPGSDFDVKSIAESRRSSFIRLYGLSDQPVPRKKKKVTATTGKGESFLTAAASRKAVEAAANAVLKDVIEEPPEEGGVQGEDLNG